MVPDWLYFRREHAGQGGKPLHVRRRCANLDPRRASRLRNPVARLYAEYIWGYVTAIRRAPLSAGGPAGVLRLAGPLARRPGRCRWSAGRLRGGGAAMPRSSLRMQPPGISIDAVVAGPSGGGS